MDCNWLKTSPSLSKGITVINQIDEAKFEQFLKRIVIKLRQQNTEIFTEEERNKLEKIFNISEEQLLLAIKSIIYVFKRMLKYIFMPADLKSDLVNIGFNNEKSDFFVKVWSTETSTTLNELASKKFEKCDDHMNISWKLNTELSSEYHRKCKIPKAYLSIGADKKETEMELTHKELHSIFLQFVSIQNELDNILV
ncbi:COMM domain-containing protein 10 [Epargyreus clarus]|uniref:COMM domain-containing protein 10 n=1 Tax=Epargyreus clarus TaxID=520877 RepID=UPI003C2D21A9